jgi:cell wall-associated NlpC family hydrolase
LIAKQADLNVQTTTLAAEQATAESDKASLKEKQEAAIKEQQRVQEEARKAAEAQEAAKKADAEAKEKADADAKAEADRKAQEEAAASTTTTESSSSTVESSSTEQTQSSTVDSSATESSNEDNFQGGGATPTTPSESGTGNTNSNNQGSTSSTTNNQTPSTPAPTPTPTPAPSGNGSGVVAEAMKYIGTPYVWGGKTPAGFDCSGFTSYVFRQATGREIGGWTVPQESAGTRISVGEAQAGDLYFWGSPGGTYHVAIAMGGGQYIHAPQPGETVTVSSVSYYAPSFAVRM